MVPKPPPRPSNPHPPAPEEYKPLAAARRRLTPPPKPGTKGDGGAGLRRYVARRAPAVEARRKAAVQMVAAGGMTQGEVAAALNVSKHTVAMALAKPKSREELGALREKLRTLVMERTAAGLMEGTLDVVQTSITDGDAKSLELSTRAATNLEKLVTSASGETQRVEVTGIPAPTHLDLKVLIAGILGRDVTK